ncbi:MAG: TrmO family methyltransferase [Thermincola sp.]|jgi:formylmethanofuran dehydrogenase subunit E|nr:TrmO family methyltransferase [Thermincola sp.]MDT3702460.1 TrmO family methyltransferase [Thermincola sp.]
MQDALLETTIKFHGHLCPGIVTGYRAGLLAVKRLNSGMPLGIQYVVVAENDVCGLDGIQIVTGCTIGNDALIIENRGKQAFRFINKKNGQGMRISLKLPLWTSNEPIMLHEKVKIGTATAQEKDEFFRLRHERGAELLNYNDDELFDVTFGLRAFSRPNPIGLTVVKLEKVEGNMLTVSDLDFIDGTPILDIKSYYEQDIIFSPTVPYIRPADSKMLEQMIMKQALNHHREKCAQLVLAVKMAILAEKELGQLAADNIKLTVKGSRCLGDTFQGITQAKLANPSRFFFIESGNEEETVWEDGSKVIKITIKNGVAGMNTGYIEKLPADMLFKVEMKNK